MTRDNGWAVFFDAVGTLINPHPTPATVYHRVGRSFGSKLELDTVRKRFRQSFLTQDQLDSTLDWQTNEGREETRWRTIVAETLPDVSSPEDCFLTLYEYFARPEAWRLDAKVVPVLQQLTEEGYQLGICSNFDQRLRGIVAAMPELSMMKHLIVSSEVGWRKPAREFFQRVQECVGFEPSKIFVVGDDLVNDCNGAAEANFRPIYFNYQDQIWGRENQIGSWGGLIETIQSITDRFR